MLIERSNVSRCVIGCAVRVHRDVGAGLLESAYFPCLMTEFEFAGLDYQTQVPIPVRYHDRYIECAYRADFVIENELILEVKSIARFDKVHDAQLLTYLRLLQLHEGLLINFNVPLLKQGIRRILL